MTDQTPLDAAHRAAEAAPDDTALRLRMFERLAESELFLLLDSEAVGDTATPRLFDVDGTRFALAFDTEARLTDFTGSAAPFAAMSGRVLAGLLAAEGLGLALNPEVAPSSQLLPPDALSWLASHVATTPETVDEHPAEIAPPTGVPESLLHALDSKLALMQGRATGAYLAHVSHRSGARGHLLAFIDPAPGAEHALARAVQEVLSFSGLEAGQIDVAFLRKTDPMAATLARVGLRFDLPQQSAPDTSPTTAPGRDPDKPPILR